MRLLWTRMHNYETTIYITTKRTLNMGLVHCWNMTTRKLYGKQLSCPYRSAEGSSNNKSVLCIDFRTYLRTVTQLLYTLYGHQVTLTNFSETHLIPFFIFCWFCQNESSQATKIFATVPSHLFLRIPCFSRMGKAESWTNVSSLEVVMMVRNQDWRYIIIALAMTQQL